MRIFLVALLLLSGCAPTVTPADELDRTLRAYNGHLRWKRFTKAVAFLPKEKRDEFMEVFEPSEDQLNIDDVEVKHVDIDKDKAKVSLEARFYRLPSITMEKVRIVQKWERIHGAWWLVSPADVPFFKPYEKEKPSSAPVSPLETAEDPKRAE